MISRQPRQQIVLCNDNVGYRSCNAPNAGFEPTSFFRRAAVEKQCNLPLRELAYSWNGRMLFAFEFAGPRPQGSTQVGPISQTTTERPQARLTPSRIQRDELIEFGIVERLIGPVSSVGFLEILCRQRIYGVIPGHGILWLRKRQRHKIARASFDVRALPGTKANDRFRQSRYPSDLVYFDQLSPCYGPVIAKSPPVFR